MDNITKEKEILKEKVKEEVGGFKGQEPTTYGDWQHNGKTTDF